ncbi:hypothetical protein [Agrobacterium arsenijevicii]|uniref:Phage protein n=1 Tax=Agrobacterium arsenijevicii TaxID=1585697 RepID=A0ABR5D7Y8_9HYPH|nr:hypothetical protein RP75_13425 [Agrobacterium arsenijevicii]
MKSKTAISRELLGKIVDEVFDGAIEDSSVIEEIYAVIRREEAALSAAEPRGYLVHDKDNPDGRYFKHKPSIADDDMSEYEVWIEPLYAAPPALSVAVKALDMDKATNPDWVTKDFTQSEAYIAIRAALSAQVQDVAEGKELGRFELWFFHHLTDDQRTALFALNGYPTTGMDTHGKQKIALKHWFSRLPAAPAKQEGGADGC